VVRLRDNLDNAQFEVSQRIAQILTPCRRHPQPFVIKFDITSIPVVSVTVASDLLDEKQLYDLAYNTIEPQLERVPGVASATVGGARSAKLKSWPTAMPCGRAAWISWL